MDEYTIEDLKATSADLEANGENSKYYDLFYKFMEDDEIWWCNSNGQQPATCTAADSTTFDVSKANHDYVCNYTRDNDDTNIDNYPMMRVIGVLHDYKAGTTKTTKEKAGLTFQYIHSVHFASQQGQTARCWWGTGNCDVRNKLQDGGTIFNETNSAITSQIQAVDKWYQINQIPDEKVEIAISQDKMFVPSYSELWNKNQTPSTSSYSTYNNVASFDSVGNPESEGYVYEWAKLHDIDGASDNEILINLGNTNSDNWPICDDSSECYIGGCWERSSDWGTDDVWVFIDTSSALGWIFNNVDANPTRWVGVAPCFCF